MMVYPYKMEFASWTVVLAVIQAAHIIKADVCSKDDEVFRGFARDRSIISNTKTVRQGVSILSMRHWCLLQRILFGRLCRVDFFWSENHS